MQTLQIPPSDPVTSGRPQPDPAQGDLFSSQSWESAYRDTETVPVLLVQLQDDLSRARMREAFWISLIVHLVIVIALWNSPTLSAYLIRLFPRSAIALSPSMAMKDKDTTFLALPPDAEKITKAPKTDKLSDKNRIAQSRHTQLDRNELRKILDASRAGAPGLGGIPAPKSAPSQTPPQVAQYSGPPAQQQQQQASQASPPQTNQMAKLTQPFPPKGVFATGGTAGSAIESAARAAAANRGGYGGGGGDYGLGQGRQPTDVVGNMDVLSDTQGVDFGPYLARVLHDVKLSWYNLIPEVARPPIMKKGKVSIEFAITKQGQVAGMRLVGPSGDVSLDRAAWGGITGSNPFPPLPNEFNGQYLALRFHFYYNPDRNDLE
ncbi:MAG TPA: energy transducer TonB [Terriglobales bacterium]|nr:energy transducer TonB [Terriglobales bacterium]